MDSTVRHEQQLRKAYDAFNARDIGAALSTMVADVEWPNGMEGGYVHGHQEIRDYWTRQWGLIDPTVTPMGFTHQRDEVVVDVRQVVRDLAGATLADMVVQHAYRFDGELIRFMEIRHSSEASG